MPLKDLAKRKAYMAAHYQSRREEFIAMEKARYHQHAGVIRERRLELAYRHRAINAERERQRYARYRDIVLSHYRKKCACCGEDETLFLEVDHIRNDGNRHRKTIGTSAMALLRWIIAKQFPSEFQLLCANCNQGKKRAGGVCPHQLKNGQLSSVPR